MYILTKAINEVKGANRFICERFSFFFYEICITNPLIPIFLTGTKYIMRNDTRTLTWSAICNRFTRFTLSFNKVNES